MKAVVQKVTDQISIKIKQGHYGEPGEKFLTVKMLAEEYRLSTESAFRVINSLSNLRLIRRGGKRYYLTHGFIAPSSPYGRILAKTRKNSFGMIVNRIESPFYAAVIRELSIAVSKIESSLYVLCCNNSIEREAQAIDELLELGVRGIFTNAGISSDIKEIYSTCPLPVVSIGRNLEIQNCDAVLVDNEAAGRQVANHLLNCGCRHFAYVGIARYMNEDPRLRGYLNQLQKNNIVLTEDCILSAEHNHNGKGNIENIAGQLDSILKNLPKGEKLGIFCYHDLLATAVIQRVRHYSHQSTRSYNIPQDVAVVGFDDLPVAETITPALTTVHYQYQAIANESLTAMLKYLQNSNHRPNIRIVPSSLFIRESSYLG